MYSRTRGYLPYFVQPKEIYFVTFRLGDSLPTSVLIQFKEEAKLGKSYVSATK
jgi:hypothetical protein